MEINTEDIVTENIGKKVENDDTYVKTTFDKEQERVKGFKNGSKYHTSLKKIIRYPALLNTNSECFVVRFEKKENLLAAGIYIYYF